MSMITIEIKNGNICQMDGDRKALNKLYDLFRIKHPNAWHILMYQKGKTRWDGYIKYISEAGRFKVGLLPKVVKEAKMLGQKVKIIDCRPPIPDPVIPKSLGDRELYPRQIKSLEKLLLHKLCGIRFNICAGDLAVGFGKCIEGSSLIHTNRGIFRIDEIINTNGEFEKGIKVLSQDGKYHYINGATFDKMKALRITTKLGYTQICGYDHHRYYTIDKSGHLQWVLARDLKVGDYIPIKFGKPYGKNKSLTPDQAYLIGVIQGDGHVKLNTPTRVTINISGQDYEIANKILPVWNSLCKRSTKVKPHHKFKGWHISHSDKLFSKWFIELCPELLGTAFEKKVPKVILDSPLEVQYAYMAGLIDTDGSRNTDHIEYSFSSICQENIHRIQYMLLNWGILSYTSSKKTSWTNKGTKKKSITYRLRIPALEAIKFGKLIPIQVFRKQVPEEWMNRNNLFYQLPKPIGELAREHYLNQNYNTWNNPFTQLKHHEGRTLISQLLYPNRITKESLSLLLKVSSNPYLEEFLEFSKGVYWDKIKSIEVLEDIPCYDISVPDIHSYVADGFICHNSSIFASIHQAYQNKLRTILLLNDADLFNQFKREIPPMLPGIDIKFIQGKVREWGDFNVAMVQSISRNLRYYQFDLSQMDICLIDEADIIDNRTYKGVIEHLYNTRIRIGLSGTIYMSKLKKDLVHNMNIMSFIGDKVDTVKLIDQIKSNKATPVVVKMIPVNTQDRNLADYQQEYLETISTNLDSFKASWERTLYNAKYHRFPMLIVTKFIDHCENLYKYYQEQNQKLGTKFKINFVHHKIKNRTNILENFRTGKLDILISTTIISRGKNFPTLRYLQNTASMDSNEKAIQILGRLVRKSEGKDKAYLDDLMFPGHYLARHARHRARYYKTEKLKVIKIKSK